MKIGEKMFENWLHCQKIQNIHHWIADIKEVHPVYTFFEGRTVIVPAAYFWGMCESENRLFMYFYVKISIWQQPNSESINM